MAERWGRWFPDCRNKLINKKTDPFRLNLLLKFPWMQIEIKSFTKSWMKTMISVSRNMCDPRSKNTNIDIKPFEKHYAVQQSFHQSEWAEMCRDLGETTSEPHSTHPVSDWAEWLWAEPQSLQNSKTGASDGGRRGYSGGVAEIPSTPQSIQESLML